MRTYIVSRDIVINMFYPTWRVFTDDRTVSKLTATKNQLIEQGGILATKLCFGIIKGFDLGSAGLLIIH